MSILRINAFLLTLLSTSVAFAQDHEGGAAHHGNDTLFILLIVNFCAYIVLMSVLYKKKVQPRLSARTLSVRAEIQRAAAELEREQEELRRLTSALESIDDEEEDVIEAFRQEGVRSAEAIRRQGLDEMQRREKEVEQLKANLFHQLESEIRQEMAALAMKKAEERLTTSFTTEMDRTLRRNVIQTFVQ